MVVGLGGFRTRRKEVGRHGAICDHSFAALVAELEIGVVDRVEVANRSTRDFCRAHGARGADLRTDRAVFNVLDALDLVLVFGAHKNRQARDVVGLGEKHALGALGRDRKGRSTDIGDTREHRRNDRVKAHVGHFELAAHVFGDVLKQVDFKPFEFAGFAVKENKRRVGTFAGHAKHLGVFGVSLNRDGGGSGADNGRNGLFHLCCVSHLSF